jgi:hypothetical protein
MELGTETPAPDVGIGVERVEVAESGIAAVGGYEWRSSRREADDRAFDRHDDGAGVRQPGSEVVRPELFSVGDGQGGEDVVGEQASVGGAPGLHEHSGDGMGVGRRRGAQP